MTRLARCVLALGLLLAPAGCDSAPKPARVTIMIPWSGEEFRAFYSVIKKFHEDTGIDVDVEVTRALTQQLDAAVAADSPPDLAMLPSVGAITRYAKERRLQPLDAAATRAYVQPFAGLATVKGRVFAVPVKADVKSLIWFHPAAGDKALRPPTSPSALRNFVRKNSWTACLGLASGPTSGWPGADWIADILLADRNGDTYRKWLSGGLKWDTPQVKKAWTTWRSIVDSSAPDAYQRAFDKAAAGMTGKSPTCSFGHGALSAVSFQDGKRPGVDYDYVPSSSARRLEVSADFIGKFTKNPSAEKLIRYLSGAKAQQLWVNKPGAYAFSANSQVKRYQNPVQDRIARMLRPRSGYTLCFSAADAMSPDVSAAFYRAVVDYATDTENLTKLLDDLDAVQKNQNSPIADNKLCATLN